MDDNNMQNDNKPQFYPNDILFCIFQFMEPENTKKLSIINKQFFSVISDEYLWKYYCHKYLSEKEIECFFGETNRYYECYKKWHCLKQLYQYINNIRYNFYKFTSCLHLYKKIRIILDGYMMISIPKSIKYMTKLHSLICQNNKIKILPVEVCHMSSLKQIFMGCNEIMAIPKEICHLDNLRILNLSNNKIDSMPEELYDTPNLRELYLQKNQINEIPKGISKLKKLIIFVIDNNDISGIPNEIFEMQNLNTFRIQNNKIKKVPAEFLISSINIFHL